MSKQGTALILTSMMRSEEKTFTIGDSYQMIRDAVDGYIECVHLPSIGVDMWCNEEGKLIGLPQNDFASLFFQKDYGVFDSVRGDVIFTGGVDKEGETLGLTDTQLDELKKRLGV